MIANWCKAQAVKKLTRFIEAWRWLLAIQLEKFKINVFQAIFYGAAVRVNAILGFVATVKCVIWMADPESIPIWLSSIMPSKDWIHQSVLILIPGGVFLVQAMLQSRHDKCSNRLQHLVADEVIRLALIKAVEAANAHEAKAIVSNGELLALPRHYRNILTIETKLLSVISMTIVLISVLGGGFFIHWETMGLMLVVGLTCTLIFFFSQHRTSHVKKEILNTAKDRESLALRNVQSFFHENSRASVGLKTDARHGIVSISDLALSRLTEKTLASQSTFLMNLGQAAIVVIFLSVVLIMAIDDLSLGSIAILAIVFRFILGYAVVITRDASYLLANHHKLIGIKKKCD